MAKIILKYQKLITNSDRILTLYLGAHLRRQFEFVQSEWVNNGLLIGAGDVTKIQLQEPMMG
jgi:hypothetical protein